MLRCKLCSRWFKNKRAYFAHLKFYHAVAHPKKAHEKLNQCDAQCDAICPLCGVEFKDKQEMKDHLKSFHRARLSLMRKWLKG